MVSAIIFLNAGIFFFWKDDLFQIPCIGKNLPDIWEVWNKYLLNGLMNEWANINFNIRQFLFLESKQSTKCILFILSECQPFNNVPVTPAAFMPSFVEVQFTFSIVHKV